MRPIGEAVLDLNESGALKKYNCEHCEKTFERHEHMERHSRVHTGERPFGCPYEGCFKSFSRYDNMLQHYRCHLCKGYRNQHRDVRKVLRKRLESSGHFNLPTSLSEHQLLQLKRLRASSGQDASSSSIFEGEEEDGGEATSPISQSPQTQSSPQEGRSLSPPQKVPSSAPSSKKGAKVPKGSSSQGLSSTPSLPSPTPSSSSSSFSSTSSSSPLSPVPLKISQGIIKPFPLLAAQEAPPFSSPLHNPPAPFPLSHHHHHPQLFPPGLLNPSSLSYLSSLSSLLNASQQPVPFPYSSSLPLLSSSSSSSSSPPPPSLSPPSSSTPLFSHIPPPFQPQVLLQAPPVAFPFSPSSPLSSLPFGRRSEIDQQLLGLLDKRAK